MRTALSRAPVVNDHVRLKARAAPVSSKAHGRVQVRVSSVAPAAAVTATGPGAPTTGSVGLDGSATLDLPAAGTWRVCASSGGEGTDYVAGSDCLSVTVSQAAIGPTTRAPVGVALPARLRHGGAIRLLLTSRRRFAVRFR